MSRLSLPVSVLISALVLAAAILWSAESQRYAIAGDGASLVRLDRRTGETEVCLRERALSLDQSTGNRRYKFIAVCDGFSKGP